MKNTIISFIIFFIVLGFVIVANNKLINVCNETLELADELETLIENELWEESYDKALELKLLMNKNFNSVSVYINHQDFDQLNTEILKLTQYIDLEDSSEGLATLHAIKCYAEYLKELQEISIVNIL